MALFPTDAKDGEIFAAGNGKNYVYQEDKNVWQSTDCVPKWSDQVYIRGVDNRTQQNVNDSNQAVATKVGNVATATNQLLDVAFDVRCRGVWIYQGGAVAPGDPPVGLQRFLMTDAEGVKTQEYSEAASLTIHAIGAGQLDKISIGETEIGDLITIQNSSDLSGGSYIVTDIEEFGNGNPDELTETYAIYTVVADTKRCSGSVATEEKAVIRIIPQQAVPAFEDEYLALTGGTMSGTITSDQTAGSALIVKKNGRNTVRIDQGGKIYCNYDPEIDEDPTTVLTRGFAEANYVRTTKNSTMTDSYLRINKADPNTHLILDFKRGDQSDKSNRFIDIKEDDQRLVDIQSTAAGFLQVHLENETKEFKLVGKVDGRDAQMFKVYANGKIGLFNVKTPANSGDCANKQYVDDKFDAAGGAAGFNPCVFTCQSEQNITLLEPGQFFINSSGSIVLHHAMADGVLWCIKREGTNHVQEVPGIVTISELGGRTMFQGTISKLTTFGTPSNATHCTLETSWHDKKTCLDGVQYLITIPGILPRLIKT